MGPCPARREMGTRTGLGGEAGVAPPPDGDGEEMGGSLGSDNRVQKPGLCGGLQAKAPLGSIRGNGLGVLLGYVEASGIFFAPPTPQKVLALGLGMDPGAQRCLGQPAMGSSGSVSDLPPSACRHAGRQEVGERGQRA